MLFRSERAAPNLKPQDEDPVLAAVRNAAAREGLWVHLGSLAIRRDDGKLANRAFVIDPAGDIRATYDKLHLFDVDLPNGESWRESASYAPGEGTVVVEDTPVGRLGLTICYDLRFPALFAALAEAGAETIAVPAAFTVPTGRAHWEILLRARAIEAGVAPKICTPIGRWPSVKSTISQALALSRTKASDWTNSVTITSAPCSLMTLPAASGCNAPKPALMLMPSGSTPSFTTLAPSSLKMRGASR